MKCFRTLLAFHLMAWNKRYYYAASLLLIYAVIALIYYYQMYLLPLDDRIGKCCSLSSEYLLPFQFYIPFYCSQSIIMILLLSLRVYPPSSFNFKDSTLLVYRFYELLIGQILVICVDLPLKFHIISLDFYAPYRPQNKLEFVLGYFQTVLGQVLTGYTNTIFIYYCFQSFMSYETRIMAIGLVYKEITVVENMHRRSYNYLDLLVSKQNLTSAQIGSNFGLGLGRIAILLFINSIFAWRLCNCSKSIFRYYQSIIPYQPKPFYQSHFEEFRYEDKLTNKLVWCKSLTKHFWFTKRDAIDDIHSIYCRGMIHGIYGPNGSGKSTLLKCLAKIIRPSKGQVRFFERRGFSMSYYDNTTASKLFYGLNFSLKMSMKLSKKPKLKQDAFINEILTIGSELPKESPLLPILHVFVQDADLMLFDEPFSNLNENESEELSSLIVKAADLGKSILIATHNVRWIEQYAHDLMFLSRGVAISIGSIPFYSNLQYRYNRCNYTDYSTIIPEMEVRAELEKSLQDMRGDVSVNPLSSPNEVCFRANEKGIQKIQQKWGHDFQFAERPLQANLEEALQDMFFLEENDPGFRFTRRQKTCFFMDQESAIEAFGTWFKDSQLPVSSSEFWAHLHLLLLLMLKLWLIFLLLVGNFVQIRTRFLSYTDQDPAPINSISIMHLTQQATFVMILFFVKLELRKKELTFGFIMAMVVTFLLTFHLAQLIAVYAGGVSLLNGFLLFLHKVIELILLCSFSSFLFILGTNKISAYLFLLLLVLCPYLSKILNYFNPSVLQLGPAVSDSVIFLFPPIVSIRVASFLLFDDYRAKLQKEGDKFLQHLSIWYVFLIFIIYTAIITFTTLYIVRVRYRAKVKKYYESIQNQRESTFGFQVKKRQLYTNQYTVISEEQLEYWDNFLNREHCFGFPSLTVSQALVFAGRRAGYFEKPILERRKQIVIKFFRLFEKEFRLMRELSQGEQKKALIAMEFMHPRGHLYFDRPLENLDTFTSKRVQTLLWLLEREKVKNFQVDVKGDLPLLEKITRPSIAQE